MLDGREQEFLKGKLSGFNIKNITTFVSKKKKKERKRKKKKNVINSILFLAQVTCTMASFYYYDQNPFRFAFDI